MIEPVAYKKKIEGKSNAHLITFNDGKDYVIKYFQPGFEKTLPNEWLSYCLARYLDLPIPYAEIIQIPHSFSSQVPNLVHFNESNYQFASLYIPNCHDGHQTSHINSIINVDSLAKIIVFDYWLYNKDRTRKNILLKEKIHGTYELLVVDHAEIFGTYNWQITDLPKLPFQLIKSATHEMMAKFIPNETCFYEQIELIQMIPIHLIEEIVEFMPDEWLSKEDRKEIVHTLVTRRKRFLKKVIEKFIKNIYHPLHDEIS